MIAPAYQLATAARQVRSRPSWRTIPSVVRWLLVVVLACVPRSEARHEPPVAPAAPGVDATPVDDTTAIAMTDAGIAAPPAPPVWYRKIIAVKPAQDGSTLT